MFIISPLKRVGSQSSRTNVKYSAAVVLKSIFRFDRIIPESVPWLIAKSRDEEAKTILETAARWNGIDLPQKFRSKCNAAAQYVKGEDMDSHQHHPLGANNETQSDKCAVEYTLIDLFRSPTLLRHLLVLFCLW